jgi:ubiquinol-cytochrome c reductase subunit 9
MFFYPGVFVSSIFVGAFAFGIGFDVGITAFWDRWNKGVRGIVRCNTNSRLITSLQKQWKDIRDRYATEAAEE